MKRALVAVGSSVLTIIWYLLADPGGQLSRALPSLRHSSRPTSARELLDYRRTCR